ncbi:MAG: hypothetical protein WCE64_05230 [Bacteroidales bacterium]
MGREMRGAIVLLLSIMTLAAGSCISSKHIPASRLSKIPDRKNLYYFHCDDSTWIVRPVPSAGNIFAGIIFKPAQIKKSRNVSIYASPLSDVKINDGVLTIPMQDIYKVENFRISAGMILGAVGVVTFLFLIPVFL